MAKVSKPSVHYRPATGLLKWLRRCGTCSMLRGDRCTLVAGKIRPEDVCDKWEPK